MDQQQVPLAFLWLCDILAVITARTSTEASAILAGRGGDGLPYACRIGWRLTNHPGQQRCGVAWAYLPSGPAGVGGAAGRDDRFWIPAAPPPTQGGCRKNGGRVCAGA